MGAELTIPWIHTWAWQIYRLSCVCLSICRSPIYLLSVWANLSPNYLLSVCANLSLIYLISVWANLSTIYLLSVCANLSPIYHLSVCANLSSIYHLCVCANLSPIYHLSVCANVSLIYRYRLSHSVYLSVADVQSLCVSIFRWFAVFVLSICHWFASNSVTQMSSPCLRVVLSICLSLLICLFVFSSFCQSVSFVLPSQSVISFLRLSLSEKLYLSSARSLSHCLLRSNALSLSRCLSP